MDRHLQLEQLIDGAEELLTQLADPHNPKIQEMRERVDRAVSDTRRALVNQETDAVGRLRDVAASLDDFVHDYPRLALITGILLAGTVGFIAGSARRRRLS